MAKASGIKSETFNKEIDKQIAEAVIDDNETMKTINDEIDATRTVIGQFQTTEVEGKQLAKKRRVPKDKKTKIPKKYLSGLKGAKRSARATLLKTISSLYKAGAKIPMSLLKRRNRS